MLLAMETVAMETRRKADQRNYQQAVPVPGCLILNNAGCSPCTVLEPREH